VADVLGAHPRLSPRDAIHAAVVLTYGLEGIVSTDRAFGRVPGLVRFDPAELAREGG
jgi:predicted nucleic acid-binding protein